MKLMLDVYNEAIEAIYNHFGFKRSAGWRDLPIEDATMWFWYLDQGKDYGYVVFAEDEETLMDRADDDCYENKIHTHEDLHEKVYRTEEYTMVLIKQAGWEFLQILDNDKERKDFRANCHVLN